jgi:hypothetical protein
VVLGSLLLSACGSGNADAAHAARAKLDAELVHARIDLALPERVLTPIVSQEWKVASGDGGILYNYDDAARTYTLLYTHLQAIEQSAPLALRQQALANMQAFAAILDERRAEGFSEIAAYQARYDAAEQALVGAKTPADFAHVSDLAIPQADALQALWTAYQKLQALRVVIQSLLDAGANTGEAQQMYDQDLQVVRDAASPERYDALTGVIDAQIVQVEADEVAAQPAITWVLLAELQARVGEMRDWGDAADADTLQRQYADDARQLAAISQPGDYLALARTIERQNDAMAPQLIEAKATYDLGVLQRLVATAQTYVVLNPADGREYAIAPEYADHAVGVGHAADQLHAARSLSQYQSADFEIESLLACLRAQLDERDLGHPRNAIPKDTTPDHAHATDLELLRYFNLMSGRVVMVSLAEQVARFYEDGVPVYWTLVTTGSASLPSPPGWHTAISRAAPTVFISLFPPGSPDYFAPTQIHYSVNYYPGGYFLHDAWWRSDFGLYTNLPHHDPAAFNGGSAGCINVPLAQMGWVYDWTLAGTPIILY